jgi:hypothetical protein
MMTKEQANEFLAGVCGVQADAGSNDGEMLATAFNGLDGVGISAWDIIAKVSAIIKIVTGTGTWAEKIAAIFALFNKEVPSDIKVPG